MAVANVYRKSKWIAVAADEVHQEYPAAEGRPTFVSLESDGDQ